MIIVVVRVDVLYSYGRTCTRSRLVCRRGRRDIVIREIDGASAPRARQRRPGGRYAAARARTRRARRPPRQHRKPGKQAAAVQYSLGARATQFGRDCCDTAD